MSIGGGVSIGGVSIGGVSIGEVFGRMLASACSHEFNEHVTHCLLKMQVPLSMGVEQQLA